MDSLGDCVLNLPRAEKPRAPRIVPPSLLPKADLVRASSAAPGSLSRIQMSALLSHGLQDNSTTVTGDEKHLDFRSH